MNIPIAAEYIKKYENMGFGMFVHWGLYSQLKCGEWYYDSHDISMDDYKKLAETFTAEDFNAKELVGLAKAAGCRYITLTTRHHEGFSLYDTCGLNDFDAVHSPAKRDLVREFVDECNRQGIVPFFYHTTLDWYNKDFENDFDKYLEYLKASVEILCKNYGKIGGFWFDGNWSRKDVDWKEEELYRMIRSYQPETIIVNNTGLSALGKNGNNELDVVTFEQGIPHKINREGMNKYKAAEMCQTLNKTWGVSDFDFEYKSPIELIKTLCICRRYGANYMLNIGPQAQGGIVPMQNEIMRVIGRWMDIFGEAIYCGRPYNAVSCGENYILKNVDGKSLYIFCFKLSYEGNENVVTTDGTYSGTYGFGNVFDRIDKIFWMDNNESLEFNQYNDSLTVKLTGNPYGISYGVRVAKATIIN